MNERSYLMNFIARSRVFIFAAFAVFLFVFVFFIVQAQAQQIFQFKSEDKNYTAALAAVAADEAEKDINIEEKIKSDEDFQPEDFGLQSVGLLPTNPFYFFKNTRRGVTSFFTFNPIKKAELNLQFAAEKLLEAKTLAEREGVDAEDIRNALNGFGQELGKVKTRMENVAEQAETGEAEELSKKMMDSMIKYGKSITKLEKELPPEIFAALNDVKEKNAETFGAVFKLAESQKISENLVKILDKQKGSEFKQFKNLEILKEIKNKAPAEAKDAIKIAENDSFLKLQNELENFDSGQKALFEDFVRETGGSELRHLEIINELEVRPLSKELREAVIKAKEGTISRTEDRLIKLPAAEKDKFFNPFRQGELKDMRVIKELENNVRPEIFVSVAEVKNEVMKNFVNKFNDVKSGGKQEILTGMEQFHDAKSIAILEEIKDLIPDDKKNVFEEIKKKAVDEIKRDINQARNSNQREVILSSLAGDHPEEAEAMEKFRTGADQSLRGVFSGIQEAILKGIRTRVETISNKDRLLKYEEEFNKIENLSKIAPQDFRNINNFFEDRKVVFESPDKAQKKIEEARKYLNDLKDLVNSLPLDAAYQDSGFDPAVREVERMLQLAEKKLDIALTVLGYNDVGRAFGEAQAAESIAKNGIRFAQDFKFGKKRMETQRTVFIPFFENQQKSPEKGIKSAENFTIYNPYEFSQYCFFVQGFMKGPSACVLPDGRIFNIEGKAFPLEIPPEFVPRKIETMAIPLGQTACPALFAPSPDFCPDGKVVYEKDQRGCDMAPRCEIYKDQQYRLNLHPTDKSICGGLAGYQCVAGYRCEYPDVKITDAFGKCVPETQYNTCQAYFSGFIFDPAKNICRQDNFTGCRDPFIFHNQLECEKANNIGSIKPEMGICPAMPTVASCPAGERKVMTYSSPECGTYYACEPEKAPAGIIYPYTFSSGFMVKDYIGAKAHCLANPPGSGGGIAAECETKFGIVYGTTATTTSKNWIQKIWKFSDGSTESSMILNRTDAEYQNYLAKIDAQCRTIPRTNFRWKSGAGDDRPENWENFGIPDCSGTAVNYICGNNVCDPGETSANCSVDCGGTTIKPQCSDGIDNDNDGKTDYPADTSCYDGADTDEWYPSSTTTATKCTAFTEATCNADPVCKWVSGFGCGVKAQCNDGIDNDNDGFIDYLKDTGCTDNFDDSESMSGTSGSCFSQTSEAMCKSAGCAWYIGHYDGTHCDDTAHGQTGTTTGVPSPGPSGLTFSLGGASTVFNWTDNSFEESNNLEERAQGATAWSIVTSIGGVNGTGSITYPNRSSGAYDYQVKACNSKGCSTPSNIVSITVAACSSPSTCFDSAICTSSGWYWYSGGCWSSPQTSANASCLSDQYWNGTACVTTSTSGGDGGGSGCGSWMSQSDCASHTGCLWNSTGNYCYYQ